MKRNHGHDQTHDRAAFPVVEVDIRNAYDASEYVSLERYLRSLPGVMRAHLDRTRGIAHLSYDPAVTTSAALQASLRKCGYKCDCYARAGPRAQVGHPRAGAEDHAGMEHGEHAGHGAEMVRDLLCCFIISIILSLPLRACLKSRPAS